MRPHNRPIKSSFYPQNHTSILVLCCLLSCWRTTSQHQIIMQDQLKFWKAAGLERVWGCTIFLPKWCKIVPEWPMARTPRPHLAFPHTACLFITYVHVVHGSGNGASKWAEMLIGHVWGGPVVGTTIIFHPTFKLDDEIQAGRGKSVYIAPQISRNIAVYC